MLSLVYPALQFLRLQGSPADLPYRPAWLLGLMLADISLTLLQYRLLSASGLAAPIIAAPLLHMGLIWGVLWLRSRSTRWVQTMLASLSIWVLLGLLLLPPVLVLAALGVKLGIAGSDPQLARTDTAGRFLELLLLALLLWRLLAESHVLKQAAEVPFAAALAIALALLVGEQWLLAALLAASSASATP